MGWFVPQTLGVGSATLAVLNGRMALKLMVLLLVLKLIGVVVSYASGNAGGIFGPALFLVQCSAEAVGSVAHNLFRGMWLRRELKRVSGNGDDIRRHCASANDVGGHDLRDDPRLFRDRSADDFKSGQLFCFIALSTPADL